MSAYFPVKAMSLVVLYRLVQKLETNGTYAFRASTVSIDTSLLRLYLYIYVYILINFSCPKWPYGSL